MKNFIRTISFMIVTVLILSSVLPVSIYASSVTTGGENNSAVVGAKTGPDDITIAITNTEELKGSTGDERLGENGYPIGKYIVEIPVVIDAYNSSYIKDASISFGNSNFTIVDSEIANDKNIQSIKDNVIKLNSSEIDERIELNVPVSFEKRDYVAENYFNRDVTIKLTGTYVDKNGEEKTFNKQTQVNVSWNVIEKEFVAKNRIVRYFEFSENNKRNALITLELTSGVKDSRAPEKEKTLEVTIPRINNKYPELRVSADNFASEENQQQGKLILTKNVEKNENNEYKWDKENDVVYVTYIYRDVNDSFYSNIANTQVAFVTNTLTVDTTSAIRTEAEGVEILESSSPIIATATSTPSINRGSIISNTSVDTDFDVKYSLNVGYPAITNSITLKEESDASKIKTKSVTVKANELTRVLGENGTVTISLDTGSDTYEINKNNTTITIPVGKKINTITTSKPVGDGTLNVNVVKTVNKNDREELANKSKITGTAKVTNIGSDNSQTVNYCQWETAIEEPTQKVQFESKFKTLSTIKKNERMVLSVVLESDSVDDYLYKNPSLRITYPKSIKTISNVSVNVLYDDYNEFNKNITPTINNEDHTIIVELSGEQKHYISSAVSKGLLIQVVADYTLDRLAPTEDSVMKLEVYNENTGASAMTVLQKGFKVIAPTQFIIQNKMNVTGSNNFKETRETIEEDVEDIMLPLYSTAKTIDVYGTVVNNQGSDVEDVVIVGNFPSKNSRSYLGTQFNGTFDTALVGEIRVENEERRTTETPNGTYKVYYSNNPSESLDSSNWSETIIEEARSYKIVFFGTFENAKRKEFHYRVTTPEEMSYNEHTKETFALLYRNGAVSGEQYSCIEAKAIGLATKPEADFDVNISVSDYVTNQEIRNGDNVNEGEYLNVKVSITNVSNRNIKNVKAVLELEKFLNRVEITKQNIIHYLSSNGIEENIGEIKAAETVKINKLVCVDAIGLNDDSDVNEKYSIMNVKVYEGDELEFKPQEFKNKIESKTISGITTSSVEDSEIGIGDSFQQYFCVRNLTNDEIKNVQIKGKLPEGIEYDSEKNEAIKVNGLTYSYDSNTREYTITIESIPTYILTSKITINLKATNYGTYELNTKASVGNEENNLNKVNVTVAGKARNFETTHTISVPTNSVKDTDIFYFNITIKNHWDSEKTVVFRDRLDDNFIVNEYTLLQNEKEIATNTNVNLIDYNFQMKPEDVAEIRIKCSVRTQSKGTTMNLTHTPEAKCNKVEISIKPITINVTGTGEFINTKNPIIDGKYNISGTAWLDVNNNGKREETEQKISNIRMKLIDNNTNRVFVDDSGNEKITTTNSNGEYVFTDIPVGSYVVIAYYDSEKYGCGDYQNRSVAEDLNNDFIEVTYEGAVVGATNNIIIENTTASAIDISLIPRNTFDMALDKNVTNVAVSASNGKEANYNFNSELAKVEISNEKDVKYYFTIEYTLTVKNIGYIDGYAKTVIDYIPKGMTFVQEDNPGWYIKSDGYAYNNTLANKLIKAQDKAEVKIKLRKELTAEQTGIIKNSAELGDTYNTEGLEDINSKAANKDSSENDYSEALVVVALSTGGQIIRVAGIVFGVLGLGVLILSATKYKRKKKII